MRHPARAIFISFALATCVATATTAFATPIARALLSDAQIELASGGNQRCWMVETPWGPQRRCRGGGGGYGRGGDYGGWNGGYGSGHGD